MHKKLEADLMSLAHSILKMKNKDDVFALKEISKEVYEKLSMLAFVEEYVNTTPNLETSKEELLEQVETAFDKKEISEQPVLEVEKDVKLGISFWTIAANHNEPEAMLELAMVYEKSKTDLEKAKEFIGAEVFVDGEVLDKDNSSLIGYMLIDDKLERIGKVQELLQFPQQQMLVVNYAGKKHMIPFVEPIVKSVSTELKET